MFDILTECNIFRAVQPRSLLAIVSHQTNGYVVAAYYYKMAQQYYSMKFIIMCRCFFKLTRKLLQHFCCTLITQGYIKGYNFWLILYVFKCRH